MPEKISPNLSVGGKSVFVNQVGTAPLSLPLPHFPQPTSFFFPPTLSLFFLKVLSLSSFTARGGICQCRHCRRQCKIFASCVYFFIFTHFLYFFLLKLLELGEIDGLKFLA